MFQSAIRGKILFRTAAWAVLDKGSWIFVCPKTLPTKTTNEALPSGSIGKKQKIPSSSPMQRAHRRAAQPGQQGRPIEPGLRRRDRAAPNERPESLATSACPYSRPRRQKWPRPSRPTEFDCPGRRSRPAGQVGRQSCVAWPAISGCARLPMPAEPFWPAEPASWGKR